MTAPVAPALADLAAEALAKANIATVQANYSALLTRAENVWMEEVKNDIWQQAAASLNRKLRSLVTTAYAVGIPYQTEYSVPSDWEDTIDLLYISSATAASTVQAGASTTVTLNASESRTAAIVQGQFIFMTSGTSAGQYRQIITYNATSKLATVSVAWDASKTPVSGDGYIIAETTQTMKRVPLLEYNSMQALLLSSQVTLPPMWCDFGDRIKLLSAPTSVFGLGFRYFANIHKLDLAGTLMASIYQNWQQVLIQGMYWKLLQSLDDSEWMQQFSIYKSLSSNLIAQEVPWVSGVDQVSQWTYIPQRGGQSEMPSDLPPSTKVTSK